MTAISTSLIGGTNSIQPAYQSKTSETSAKSEDSFANVMSDTLSLLSDTGAQSDAASLDLLTGSTNDLSSALISTEKSEIALNLTIAIRNKAIDAYKEIMNMQI
jgi:flagellar hook-basal body complex protein FliE